MPPAPRKPSLNVDSIRVCKLQGGTIADSMVMKGIVISRYVDEAILCSGLNINDLRLFHYLFKEILKEQSST